MFEERRISYIRLFVVTCVSIRPYCIHTYLSQLCVIVNFGFLIVPARKPLPPFGMLTMGNSESSISRFQETSCSFPNLSLTSFFFLPNSFSP